MVTKCEKRSSQEQNANLNEEDLKEKWMKPKKVIPAKTMTRKKEETNDTNSFGMINDYESDEESVSSCEKYDDVSESSNGA